MIVYKTASQLGNDMVFENQEELHEYAIANPNAHHIIDTEQVEELNGCVLDTDIDGWGNTKILVDNEAYTITKFFKKYKY